MVNLMNVVFLLFYGLNVGGAIFNGMAGNYGTMAINITAIVMMTVSYLYTRNRCRKSLSQ